MVSIQIQKIGVAIVSKQSYDNKLQLPVYDGLDFCTPTY